MNERLWKREDIADYLDVTTRYVDILRATKPDFPAPLPIGKGIIRWQPEEIRAWALRQRSGNQPETRAAA